MSKPGKCPCPQCGVICWQKICNDCKKTCIYHISDEDDSDYESDDGEHWAIADKLDCWRDGYWWCEICTKIYCAGCMYISEGHIMETRCCNLCYRSGAYDAYFDSSSGTCAA